MASGIRFLRRDLHAESVALSQMNEVLPLFLLRLDRTRWTDALRMARSRRWITTSTRFRYVWDYHRWGTSSLDALFGIRLISAGGSGSLDTNFALMKPNLICQILAADSSRTRCHLLGYLNNVQRLTPVWDSFYQTNEVRSVIWW